MQIKDLLKIQNDITNKENVIAYNLMVLRFHSFTMKEKAALLETVHELQKSVKQLNKAIENNIEKDGTK